MNKRRASYIYSLGILAGLGSAALISPVLAANITVGLASATCKNPNFLTIQAAVTAASPGDHVKVCPGVYPEQVKIVTNNLTLESQKPLQAVIQAPAAMTSPKAIVLVTGAANVKIQQFTIQGPGDGGCDSIEYGVRVDGGGSAAIEKNHITHIRDNPLSGCQNGNAVQFGRAAESTVGSGSVKDNQIDDYQKTGIVVSNTGSDVDVENNTIVGVGPTALVAQNGIQISSGATATVKGNDISGNVYTPQTFVSTGMLLFSPGDTTVENNNVSANDVDIYDFQSSTNVVIKGNDTSGATFDGIDVVSSSGVTLDGNKSHDNAFDGIYMNDTGTGNTVTNNKLTANGEDGINLNAATNNTLKGNDAKSNATFDCNDDSTGTGTAGTANTWTNNKGVINNPQDICKK